MITLLIQEQGAVVSAGGMVAEEAWYRGSATVHIAECPCISTFLVMP